MRLEREMLSVTKTGTASETRTGTQIMTGIIHVRMANIFSPIATGRRAAFATDLRLCSARTGARSEPRAYREIARRGAQSEPPSVKLRMDFRNPRIVGTFVCHCHLLEHEDGGMMGTIRVEARNQTSRITSSRRTVLAENSRIMSPKAITPSPSK